MKKNAVGKERKRERGERERAKAPVVFKENHVSRRNRFIRTGHVFGWA